MALQSFLNTLFKVNDRNVTVVHYDQIVEKLDTHIIINTSGK